MKCSRCGSYHPHPDCYVCWDCSDDSNSSESRKNVETELKLTNKKTALLKYCHDFDIMATIESEIDDFEKVPLADIRKALLRRINLLSDQELGEAVCHIQTFNAVC